MCVCVCNWVTLRYSRNSHNIVNQLCVCAHVHVCVLVAQSCLTFCDPMDCSLPGSSVYGIFQARTLGWVAIPFSWGSSQPRHWTRVSCIAGGFFTSWATRDLEKTVVKILVWTVNREFQCNYRKLQYECLNVPWNLSGSEKREKIKRLNSVI